MGIIEKNWNWTRPQALVQNQQPGELISARNRGCTSSGVYVPCIYTHARWVTVGNSGFCCYTCVTYFERLLTPLFVDLNKKKKNKKKKTAWILWQSPYVMSLGRKFTVRVLFCCCLILVFSAVLIWPALAPCPPPTHLPNFLCFYFSFLCFVSSLRVLCIHQATGTSFVLGRLVVETSAAPSCIKYSVMHDVA